MFTSSYSCSGIHIERRGYARRVLSHYPQLVPLRRREVRDDEGIRLIQY